VKLAATGCSSMGNISGIFSATKQEAGLQPGFDSRETRREAARNPRSKKILLQAREGWTANEETIARALRRVCEFWRYRWFHSFRDFVDGDSRKCKMNS